MLNNLSIYGKVDKILSPFLNLSILNKTINAIFGILFMYVVIIYFFSYLFYPSSIKTKNITVYASPEDMRKVKNVLNAVEKSIKNEYLYDQNYKVEIYFLGQSVFNLLTTIFLHIDSIDGINLLDKIFITNDIIKNNKNLKGIVIHEIIHSLQAKRYGGFLQQKGITPDWVQEGYAVYISREKDYKSEENDRKKLAYFYAKSKFKEFNSYDIYRAYGLLVGYAIEHMHKSVDDLHLGKVDYDEVLDSLLKEYSIAKEMK